MTRHAKGTPRKARTAPAPALKYGSLEWTKAVRALFVGYPVSTATKNDRMFIMARVDGLHVKHLTCASATAFLARAGSNRENYAPVARLTRHTEGGNVETLQVQAYAADGTHLAAIGHDGRNFDIVG